MNDRSKLNGSQKYFSFSFHHNAVRDVHERILNVSRFTKRLFSYLMKMRSTSDDVYKEKGRFKMNYKKYMRA